MLVLVVGCGIMACVVEAVDVGVKEIGSNIGVVVPVNVGVEVAV